jgi:hypothetical protein
MHVLDVLISCTDCTAPACTACTPVLQVAPGEREVVEQLVRRCMEGADGGLLCVPLTVDVAVGESWGEAQ